MGSMFSSSHDSNSQIKPLQFRCSVNNNTESLENGLQSDLRTNMKCSEKHENKIHSENTCTSKFPTQWDKGKQIGCGSFGNVYMVIDKSNPNNKHYVVKEIRFNPQEKEMTETEIEIMTTLKQHRRIVPFYGFLMNESLASIFMGYMAMGSLADFVCNRSLHENECALFTNQILEGLEYLHNHGIIHRDIKGANVLLENEFNIRLTDFGISKIVDEKTEKFTVEKGSWRWMAPEVCNPGINNNQYSYNADIWSVGCTVIEMITGQPPYNRISNTAAVIVKVGRGERPELPKNIPKGVKYFLQNTLVHHKKRKSAKELREMYFTKIDVFKGHKRVKQRVFESKKSQKNDTRIEDSTYIDCTMPTMSETNISEEIENCTKNPGHKNFIPAEKFTKESLPKYMQQTDLFDFIISSIKLTVKIDVDTTSPERPKFWPKTAFEYPHYKLRNSNTNRYGTGMVFNLILHKDGHNKCPCQDCLDSNERKHIWGIIELMTAAHVIFDSLEAQHATCRFFYNSDQQEGIILKGFSIVNADIEKNWCRFKCISCDIDLLELIQEHFNNFQRLRKNIIKYAESWISYGFIVSHPHGGPKQVCLGRITEKRVREDEPWTQCTYDIPTCPGSSGAYVHILDDNIRVWHYPHVHTGTNEDKMNQSSVGYQYKQVSATYIFNPLLTHKAKDNKVYHTSFGYQVIKGRLIRKDEFGSTCMSDVFQNDKKIITGMIREKKMPDNQRYKERIKREIENENSVYLKLTDPSKVVEYFGYEIENEKVYSFVEYMTQGSLVDYYRKEGPVKEEQCFTFLSHILKGLQYLHENNIIHMNIQGKNIFFTSEMEVKISGFKYSSTVPGKTLSARHGNERWVAPEVVNTDYCQDKETFNTQADIWSLGCTIVEMLTADVPYKYIKSISAVIIKVGKGKAPKMQGYVSQIVKSILSDCFQSKTNSRKSAIQLLNKIESEINGKKLSKKNLKKEKKEKKSTESFPENPKEGKYTKDKRWSEYTPAKRPISLFESDDVYSDTVSPYHYIDGTKDNVLRTLTDDIYLNL